MISHHIHPAPAQRKGTLIYPVIAELKQIHYVFDVSNVLSALRAFVARLLGEILTLWDRSVYNNRRAEQAQWKQFYQELPVLAHAAHTYRPVQVWTAP